MSRYTGVTGYWETNRIINSDKRVIGSNPGSVMVFADILQDSEGKNIKLIMQSPYEDYATYMTQMVVGDRDDFSRYNPKGK